MATIFQFKAYEHPQRTSQKTNSAAKPRKKLPNGAQPVNCHGKKPSSRVILEDTSTIDDFDDIAIVDLTEFAPRQNALLVDELHLQRTKANSEPAEEFVFIDDVLSDRECIDATADAEKGDSDLSRGCETSASKRQQEEVMLPEPCDRGSSYKAVLGSSDNFSSNTCTEYAITRPPKTVMDTQTILSSGVKPAESPGGSTGVAQRPPPRADAGIAVNTSAMQEDRVTRLPSMQSSSSVPQAHSPSPRNFGAHEVGSEHKPGVDQHGSWQASTGTKRPRMERECNDGTKDGSADGVAKRSRLIKASDTDDPERPDSVGTALRLPTAGSQLTPRFQSSNYIEVSSSLIGPDAQSLHGSTIAGKTSVCGKPQQPQWSTRPVPVEGTQAELRQDQCQRCRCYQEALLESLSELRSLRAEVDSVAPKIQGQQQSPTQDQGLVRKIAQSTIRKDDYEEVLDEDAENGTDDSSSSCEGSDNDDIDEYSKMRVTRQPWTEVQEKLLRAWKREGMAESQIAKKLGRSESAVSQHWTIMSRRGCSKNTRS